jgi:ketosteroid isomerase-like protein
MPEHENIVIVRRISAAIQSGTISAANDALQPDVVWHYFNPKLPEVAGDYHGASGVERFFAVLATKSKGTFSVEPVAAHAFGGELVVTHARVSLTLDHQSITTDVIVVWRIRERRVAEVWDIPAVFASQM